MLIFKSIESAKWFETVINNWKSRTDKLVFVPCASKKPFYQSVTHRSFFKILWNMWKKHVIDLIIVSEPLTVVPADYDYPDPSYPLYDYPPRILHKQNEFTREEIQIWRKRFKTFLKKNAMKKCYFILYPYHKKILGGILEQYCRAGIYVERPYISTGIRILMNLMKNNQEKNNEQRRFIRVSSETNFLK